MILDERLPLLGSAEPTHAMTLARGDAALDRRPRGQRIERTSSTSKGLSLVAGRAAIVPVGSDPQTTAIAASSAEQPPR